MKGGRYAVGASIVIALLCVAFVGGVQVGEGRIPAVARVIDVLNKDGDPISKQVGAEQVDFTPYWRVWNILEQKFIPFSSSTAATVRGEDRLYGSIEGLVASYKDPYTVFMRPQVAQDFKIATKGSLEGIGAVIGEREGTILVVGPIPGSPAEKAGLVSGDVILKVDGVDTKGSAVNDVVSKIRGEGGTTVTLTIQSVGTEPRDVPIVRGTIEIPSTAHAVVERDVPKVAVATQNNGASSTAPVETEKQDFYVLRLFSFSESSINAFQHELRNFMKSGSPYLIIDLRGNPGGYLEAAVNIASWFVPAGSVVVRDFTGPERRERAYTTRDNTIFTDENKPKIAILVDKGSASASEILAGALQEYGVAKLVGTRTFGKGCVQELVNITDTLALKVTVSRWYTPRGVSISDGGLTPDITVTPPTATSTATTSDPWIDAAVKYFTEPS